DAPDPMAATLRSGPRDRPRASLPRKAHAPALSPPDAAMAAATGHSCPGGRTRRPPRTCEDARRAEILGIGIVSDEKAQWVSPPGLTYSPITIGGYFFRLYVTVNIGSFPSPTCMLI